MQSVCDHTDHLFTLNSIDFIRCKLVSLSKAIIMLVGLDFVPTPGSGGNFKPIIRYAAVKGLPIIRYAAVKGIFTVFEQSMCLFYTKLYQIH